MNKHLQVCVRSGLFVGVALTGSRSLAQCPYGAWAQTTNLHYAPNAFNYSPQINVLQVWDPDGAGPRDPVIVAGGGFFYSTEGFPYQTRNIAAWDGASWSPLGLGLNRMQGHYEYASYVWALAPFQGGLVGAGQFSFADEQPANNIAMWDGSAWHTLGAGTNGGMYALCVYNGRLVAAGLFTSAGGSPVSNIAAWDGAAWTPLGSGLDGQVLSLCVYNNKLIAAGSFSHSGGASTTSVAQWNGSAWSAIDAGLTGSSSVVSVFLGDLAVGTTNYFPDDSGNLSNILLWDGTNWHPLGTGTSSTPSALVGRGTDLFAIGTFTSAGGAGANHVARWDSTIGFDWEPLEAGVPSVVSRSATLSNNELVVGGYDVIHRWVEPTSAPLIVVPPAPVNSTAGATVTVHVGVNGTSALFYQWNRNGQSLSEAATRTGTRQSTLVLSPAGVADSGQYTCAITSACGNLTTNAVSVTINPGCGSADFNHDGDSATDADIEAFFACLAGNCCAACESADFNGDGDSATDADIEAFFRVLAGGSCCIRWPVNGSTPTRRGRLACRGRATRSGRCVWRGTLRVCGMGWW